MKKILVIDDEKTIRFAFKTHLSNQGHDVRTACDYESAMEAVSSDNFDVIFTDIILGARNGMDILHELKRRNIDCPVVMITGRPSIDTSAEAVRSDAFDYLPKPIRDETLFKVCANALRHKALLDEKKRIENEKERYRGNLEAIFSSLQDAVITVDRKMVILEANEAARTICGLERDRIAGKKFRDAARGCNQSCRLVLNETLKTGKIIRERHIECRSGDSYRKTVLATCSPLFGPEKNGAGAVLVLRDITRMTHLERELKERRRFHGLIGKHPKIQKIYELIEDISEIDTTVLITGESGTGKELVARALHYGGNRAQKPLIKLNCGVLSENLLESELFGHVRGAFSGAVKDKPGRFQLADGGTLFLDEANDISPSMQVKLLRALQEKEFEKVGGTETIKADVRVIAATNRDLKKLAARGKFREDLYYRLKVIEINMPPLRERREDIPLIAGHFLEKYNGRHKKHIESISDNAMAALMRYSWPGNVRELENAVEHAFVLCKGRYMHETDLPPEIKEYNKIQGRSQKSRASESESIRMALESTDWNKSKAARLLGITRQTIYNKIKEYGLKPV